ncbi:ribonuclease VapC [Kribbella sp. VKM Ac-2527]|uniref:Ribonuclease VapC n=1 Tax=Kribbella caucasensis TaxID=2512215 RepID=A0A4R6KF06_9ACTN|nr:type II toxin-antitoxin system VapC family toxin [Kribbella sp. VKM Ac-2527]TDO49133.1 ribonuclease VapC [Kribbella sp. VKM Ac-2527]
MTSVVVDTSAMVAVLTAEPGCEWILDCLGDAESRLIAAPTAVELGIVLEARAPGAVGIAHRVLRDAQITVVPFDADLADRAIDAWRRFGKGRHPAGLNLGDCFTYALAEETGFPILCVGDDFSRSDLPVLGKNEGSVRGG